jgi:hypothetical protein
VKRVIGTQNKQNRVLVCRPLHPEPPRTSRATSISINRNNQLKKDRTIMKTSIVSALIGSLTLSAALNAQVVPNQLSYQGHVAVNGVDFDGTGEFKFALINPDGSVSHWSNDGSSVAGAEPTASVSIPVSGGLYSIGIGNTNVTDMDSVPPSVFTNSDVNLRIWFDDGINGFQVLSPDQPILSVGYAMMAEQVADGAIAADQIEDGSIGSSELAPNSVNSGHIIDGEVNTQDIANSAVTTAKLNDNSVNSAKLADNIDLGSAAASGFLDLWNGSSDLRSIEISGGAHRISTYGSDGLEQIRLYGPSWGELWMHDNENNTRSVYLTAGNDSSLAPKLELLSSSGLDRVELAAERDSGILRLFGVGGRIDNAAGAVLYGDEGNGVGGLSLRNKNGSPRARLYGGPNGRMYLYNDAGNINFSAQSWDGEEAVVQLYNKFGNETIYLWGRDSADANGGQIGLKEADGTETVTIQASEIAGNGGQIVLRKSNGTASITLDADQGGDGRITTQVLQITGGSDLSEGFEITAADEAVRAGMVVSIDPENPGRLVASTISYDRNAAGVISGAGGIKPGMVMGQAGSIADGKHPVALTGRVYCLVDADYGSIQPGDLITTSHTSGHGMKVSDYNRAQGAIVGKAMTSLESGKGLVLVLVSLQ